MLIRLLPLAGLLAAAACTARAAVPADVASIPATGSVGAVALPDKKAGGRDLVAAFKDRAEATLRTDVTDILTGLRAFTEVLPEGGAYVLDVRLITISRSLGSLEQGKRQRLTTTIEGEWTWRGQGAVLREGSARLTPERFVVGAPMRADLAGNLREGFQELARLAFADLFEAHQAGLLDSSQASGKP